MHAIMVTSHHILTVTTNSAVAFSEHSPDFWQNGVIPQPCQSDLDRQEVGQQWRKFDMGLFTQSYLLQSIHMKKRVRHVRLW